MKDTIVYLIRHAETFSELTEYVSKAEKTIIIS